MEQCALCQPSASVLQCPSKERVLAKQPSESIVPTGRSGAKIRCSFHRYLRVRAVIRSPCMAEKDRNNNPTTMNTGAALGKSAQRGDVTKMHVAF